ncbi:MAG TPA: LemA family protein [Bacteroidales bacterium]|jgi:LemA protein|nr:LemA family protein [Bacteroidales bacterium]MDX9905437.1 LemA family protein [Bacteroidales bacterium]HNQ83494.1 LemA family protein [Bacteroidales bacterium]HOX77944.1 LemA family protein [Bacteroidales bacterium]HPI87168.1 LemA family protein [Bacteroidales bacterium]
MNKSLVALIVVFVVLGLFVVIALLTAVPTYNKMVSYDEGVTSAWSQVENVYQRRADLIPNLVNTVKGYAEFEKETLTQVIEARSKATSVNISAENLNEQTLSQFQQAQDGLSSALSRLLVVVEKYPDLKANQNFLELQAQLEGTENRIANERMKFNDATKTYNVYIRKFPARIFASLFGFDDKPYFKAAEGADKVPEVKF